MASQFELAKAFVTLSTQGMSQATRNLEQIAVRADSFKTKYGHLKLSLDYAREHGLDLALVQASRLTEMLAKASNIKIFDQWIADELKFQERLKASREELERIGSLRALHGQQGISLPTLQGVAGGLDAARAQRAALDSLLQYAGSKGLTLAAKDAEILASKLKELGDIKLFDKWLADQAAFQRQLSATEERLRNLGKVNVLLPLGLPLEQLEEMKAGLDDVAKREGALNFLAEFAGSRGLVVAAKDAEFLAAKLQELGNVKAFDAWLQQQAQVQAETKKTTEEIEKQRKLMKEWGEVFPSLKQAAEALAFPEAIPVKPANWNAPTATAAPVSSSSSATPPTEQEKVQQQISHLVGKMTDRMGIDVDKLAKIQVAENIPIEGGFVAKGKFNKSKREVTINRSMLSKETDLERVLTHELAHALDLQLGGNNYASRQNGTTAALIAEQFKSLSEQRGDFAGMSDKFKEYRQRPQELFANAITEHLAGKIEMPEIADLLKSLPQQIPELLPSPPVVAPAAATSPVASPVTPSATVPVQTVPTPPAAAPAVSAPTVAPTPPTKPAAMNPEDHPMFKAASMIESRLKEVRENAQKAGDISAYVKTRGLDLGSASAERFAKNMAKLGDPKNASGLSLVDRAALGLALQLDKMKDIKVFDKWIESQTTFNKGMATMRQSVEDTVRFATYGFGSLTAAITMSARSASPAHWDTLSDSISLLTGRIGGIFIPVINDAIHFVQDLADYVGELDAPTKKNILVWTLWSGAILGGVMILPRLLGLLSPLLTLYRGLNAAVVLSGTGLISFGAQARAAATSATLSGTAAGGARTAFAGLAGAVRGAGRSMLAFVAANPVGMILAVGAAIYGLIQLFQRTNENLDETIGRIEHMEHLAERLEQGGSLNAREFRGLFSGEEQQQLQQALQQGPEAFRRLVGRMQNQAGIESMQQQFPGQGGGAGAYSQETLAQAQAALESHMQSTFDGAAQRMAALQAAGISDVDARRLFERGQLGSRGLGGSGQLSQEQIQKLIRALSERGETANTRLLALRQMAQSGQLPGNRRAPVQPHFQSQFGNIEQAWRRLQLAGTSLTQLQIQKMQDEIKALENNQSALEILTGTLQNPGSSGPPAPPAGPG